MRYLLILLISSLSFLGYSQSKMLKAYLDHKQFYAPSAGNYIEFHLQFAAHSLAYEGIEGGLQAKIAVTYNISQNDSIITGDSYLLESPLMKDSIVEDFYDIKRFQLKPGNYILDLTLFDALSDGEPIKAKQKIEIDDLSNSVSLSEIMVAEYAYVGDPNSNFYKSGYEIIPKLSAFYPDYLTSIPSYLEIYNSTELNSNEFGIKQTVIDAMNGLEVPGFTKFTKLDTAEVVPFFRQINIENLPTGKYILQYTLIDRNMTELSSQEYEFERSNDIDVVSFSDEVVIDPAFQASITDDSVGFYLESLIPISNHTDVKNIIMIAKSESAEKARKYIQTYWQQTEPTNAYEAWIKYKHQVQLVETLYANNFQEGFETDRGRVYLQYGSPNDIIRKDTSPTEYPYEIWIYYKIGKYSNKRFIFYNPDLVNNAYRLLHSDMVGELKNPAWPRELSIRNSTNGNVDNPNAGNFDHWGGNSNDYMKKY